MTKPTLLLEVEQALAAANEAKAELEAFDQAHPNLSAEYEKQAELLGAIETARRLSLGNPDVFKYLSEALICQRKVFNPMTPLVVARENLADLSYEAGRAYVYASHKWDGSAERWDYLKGQGLLALSQRKE